MLGICNGFQALIKLGLVPEGRITEQKKDSPTLAMNTIGRHISKMVYTEGSFQQVPVAGARQSWAESMCNPASHGEGRFVASEEWLKKLYANGQVATQYVDAEGQSDHGRDVESKRFRYGYRGNYQRGRPYLRKDGPFRENRRRRIYEYLRRQRH